MYKHYGLAICLFLGLLTLEAKAEAPSLPPLLLDNLQHFLGNPEASEVFTRQFTSYIGVAPEHLGVAFWDSRTGEPLDAREIRELMAPFRQDSAYQLLLAAQHLSAQQLPLQTGQLQRLVDAAFLASMRQPPEHISVEFYDRRQGPSGRGGGVSGRVPDKRRQTNAALSQPSSNPERPPGFPISEETLIQNFSDRGFTAEPREGLLLFPLVVWGRTPAQLEAHYRSQLATLAAEGADLGGLAGLPQTTSEGEWQLLYQLIYLRPNQQLTAADQDYLQAWHQRLLRELGP
ncbi:hypothetical protein [Marinospirillum perlucidum]|uniref:hypothetical protein n=1 Tax=Marinospirillum perlucidum TaxID=1982602 RepID=UPI000DF46CA4|nr:hypothetical protein [Marinospirillum perlucidum]